MQIQSQHYPEMLRNHTAMQWFDTNQLLRQYLTRFWNRIAYHGLRIECGSMYRQHPMVEEAARELEAETTTMPEESNHSTMVAPFPCSVVAPLQALAPMCF
jgi:hypothetical protein